MRFGQTRKMLIPTVEHIFLDNFMSEQVANGVDERVHGLGRKPSEGVEARVDPHNYIQ